MQIGFLIEKLYTTYKRQGIPGIFTKSIRRLNSAHQRFFINKRSNKKKWKQLQNKYLGQRVFLIGNGPSLNKTPLYLLRDEYTMCFNRFSLLVERINWSPTFFTTTDNLVLNDLVTELESIIPTTTIWNFRVIRRFQRRPGKPLTSMEPLWEPAGLWRGSGPATLNWKRSWLLFWIRKTPLYTSVVLSPM